MNKPKTLAGYMEELRELQRYAGDVYRDTGHEHALVTFRVVMKLTELIETRADIRASEVWAWLEDAARPLPQAIEEPGCGCTGEKACLWHGLTVEDTRVVQGPPIVFVDTKAAQATDDASGDQQKNKPRLRLVPDTDS